MPHPADDPIAALAITRGLPGQLQKAKQNGDAVAAQAINAALARARRILARTTAPEEGWAEIVADNRQRRRW
jgi:hypothetical protein